MSFQKKNSVLIKKKEKKRFNKTHLQNKLRLTQSIKTISIYIPGRWSCIIFKNLEKNFYLFYLHSVEYYFKFAIPSTCTSIFYCTSTSTVTLSNKNFKNMSTVWQNAVNLILYLFSSFLFVKLKFKGKGYYIYKNYRNTITPQFGYYHRIYIYSFFNKVKFLSKTKILLFGLVKQDILLSAGQIKNKRSINIFTGRGVRFARQIIYKKTGKVSSYR